LRNTRYAGEYIASLRALAAGADSADTVKKPEPAASDGVQEHAAPQERERVSLPEFLAEIQAQGQALCRARGCVFRLVADGTSMLPMRRAELLRALVNLVENAARYTPRGGAVTLESHMRRAPDGAGRAVFTVQDTGPGFTPEALAKGMQPLYTGEKSRPQDGHMGLGLTFAADVARRHGGALALRNAAGGGAVAELSFPVWG